MDLSNYEERMQKSLTNLEGEYTAIRAGRANPRILDRIQIDYYGTPSPLQSVANISVPEARMIQIQPWDASLIKDIEKAILSSDLGLTPANDGKTPMTYSQFPKNYDSSNMMLQQGIQNGMQNMYMGL